jgi:subtilisin family serine protease
MAWVSYSDRTNGDLRVAKFVGSGGSGCASTQWTCTAVATAGNQGMYGAIALDSQGRPWVSHYKFDNGDLGVARYVGSGGSGCATSQWTCTTVDTTNDTGFFSSIAFDPQGAANVAYYDNQAEEVKLARFVGANGTGCATNTWACKAVDTDPAGDTGKFPSVAFDRNGKNFISYLDNTNGDIRAAFSARSGELKLTTSPTANNGDAISESHVDMGAVTDTANRDDVDCISASKTWSNGKWFEADSLTGINLNTNQCTEVAFVLDASSATIGSGYRFAVATDDAFNKSKGQWRGPVAATSSPTVTVAAPQVNQTPVAQFTATPVTGTAPLVADFDAASSSDSDGAITNYAWNFGDGQSGSGQTVEHTYTSAGAFTASLTVTDDQGATATTGQSVAVSSPSPNSATLNVGECRPHLNVSVDASPTAVTQGGAITYAASVRNDPTGPCLNVAGSDRLDGSVTLAAPGSTWALHDVAMWLEKPGNTQPATVLPTSSNRTTVGATAPSTCPGQTAAGCTSSDQYISGAVNYPNGPSIPVSQPVEVPAGGHVELPFTFFPKLDSTDETDLAQNPQVTLAIAVTDQNGNVLITRKVVEFGQAPTAEDAIVQIAYADGTSASLAVGDIAPGAQASPAPFVYTPTATDADAVKATVTASGTPPTISSDPEIVTTAVILDQSARAVISPTASPNIIHENTITTVFFAVTPTENPTAAVELHDSPTNVVAQLKDDGTNGDLVAGDGSYGANVSVSVASSNAYTAVTTTAVGVVQGNVTLVAVPAGQPITPAPSDVGNTFVDPTSSAEVIRTQILLFLDDSGTYADAVHAASVVGGSVVGRLDATAWQLQVPTMSNSSDLQGVLEELASTQHVVGAEPNTVSQSSAVYPNDSRYHNQWYLDTTDGVPNIRADQAWTLNRGGPEPIVAVLDTGVNLQHEDLQGRLLPGRDVVDDNDDPDDQRGHGTHVAGIIGATPNNGIGTAGVVWNASILPVKVFDDDPDTGVADADILEGTRWAVDRGARIINMSFGGKGTRSESKARAVDYAWDRNRLVVAAAGNDNCDDRYFPAGMDRNEHFWSLPGINHRVYDTELLSVGASDYSNNRSIWEEENRFNTCDKNAGSNWGDWVDVAAPGTGIFSAYFNRGAPANSGTNAYEYLDGTSMATPVVAGVAALIWAQEPNLSAGEVKARLINTANPLNAGADIGTGVVDAMSATFNGGFESTFDGWQTSGTANSTSSLGPIAPASGQRMGQISTGPGTSVSTSSASKSVAIQSAALEDGMLRLSFQYNVVTEEYPEFVGTNYNDDFTAQIRASNGATFVMATESVNATTFTPVSGIDFPGGDSTVGQSGWKTANVEIPAASLAGSSSIKITVSDQGDSAYDSVVLIDDFRIL